MAATSVGGGVSGATPPIGESPTTTRTYPPSGSSSGHAQLPIVDDDAVLEGVDYQIFDEPRRLRVEARWRLDFDDPVAAGLRGLEDMEARVAGDRVELRPVVAVGLEHAVAIIEVEGEGRARVQRVVGGVGSAVVVDLGDDEGLLRSRILRRLDGPVGAAVAVGAVVAVGAAVAVGRSWAWPSGRPSRSAWS